MDTFKAFHVLHKDNGFNEDRVLQLIREEPLSIRIQGHPYSVIMRTPGDEKAHAAGFCLGEGIADRPADITAIAFCDGEDTNVVTITLHPSRQQAIAGFLERREYISQTSCGLCGKKVVDELYQLITPLTDSTVIDFQKACACLEHISDIQPIRQLTRASHAAALYDADFNLLAAAEDVGRHNALDKAVGKLFLTHRLQEAILLIISSRLSYELVQKAARARIPVLISRSRPTALAADLAEKLNMTLICLPNKEKGAYIFCGRQRLYGV